MHRSYLQCLQVFKASVFYVSRTM